VLPATHRVQDENVLMEWIRRAATLAALRPKRLFVLGIEREAAVAARAYLVIGPYDDRGGFETVSFLEASSPAPSAQPNERRVLWNSGIVAGAATAFLQFFRRRVPDLILHGRAVTHSAAHRDEHSVDVSRLSESLSGLDFRRHVLRGQEPHIRVLPVPRCGWRDEASIERDRSAPIG
jgi:mannose-1-phosphate guanylyltransferase